MRSIFKIFLNISLLIFLNGCVSSHVPFNANNKSIVFLEGKPFAIPYGANFLTHTVKKSKSEIINGYADYMGCKPGSLSWISTDFLKKLDSKKVNALPTEQKYTFWQRVKNIGQAGCAYPLSKEEYYFYLNQQNQQAANARAATYYQAETSPKTTYNYHTVTGSVFHYGY